jgi:hypothetical protein
MRFATRKIRKNKYALMSCAQYPGLDGVVDGKAVVRIVIGIHDKLAGAIENPVTVAG